MRITDSWAFRRWFFLLPCALRHHPGTFFLKDVWHFPDGDAVRQIARCSCGRRTKPGEFR